MAERPIEQLTLVDMFKECDLVARGIVDHLERGFLPKVQDLERLVRPTEEVTAPQEVSDLRVRNYAAAVISSDNFTHEHCCKLDRFIQAIDSGLKPEINE